MSVQSLPKNDELLATPSAAANNRSESPVLACRPSTSTAAGDVTLTPFNTPSRKSIVSSEKRPSMRDSSERLEAKIAEVEKWKFECVKQIKKLEEQELPDGIEGELILEKIDKLRKKAVQFEESLSQFIIYEDAEYEEFVNDDNRLCVNNKIVITETDLEPLNALLTQHVNKLESNADIRAGYRCLTVDHVNDMLKIIRERGDCLVYDVVVPNEKELCDNFILQIVEMTNLRCRQKLFRELVNETYLSESVLVSKSAPDNGLSMTAENGDAASAPSLNNGSELSPPIAYDRDVKPLLSEKLISMKSEGLLDEAEDDERDEVVDLSDSDDEYCDPVVEDDGIMIIEETDARDEEADEETDTRDEVIDLFDSEDEDCNAVTDVRDKEADARDEETDVRDEETDARDEETDVRNEEADTRDEEADARDEDSNAHNKEADARGEEMLSLAEETSPEAAANETSIEVTISSINARTNVPETEDKKPNIKPVDQTTKRPADELLNGNANGDVPVDKKQKLSLDMAPRNVAYKTIVRSSHVLSYRPFTVAVHASKEKKQSDTDIIGKMEISDYDCVDDDEDIDDVEIQCVDDEKNGGTGCRIPANAHFSLNFLQGSDDDDVDEDAEEDGAADKRNSNVSLELKDYADTKIEIIELSTDDDEEEDETETLAVSHNIKAHEKEDDDDEVEVLCEVKK